jgi:outer membrane murein-binding lipoprotein Lpp
MIKMFMRGFINASVVAFVLLAGCSKRESARQTDKLAHKSGEVAYSVAKESGKIAKTAEQKLAEAARQAHAGWKEAAAKDKSK